MNTLTGMVFMFMYFTLYDFMAHKTSSIFHFTSHDDTYIPYMLNDLQYDRGAMELSTQQTTHWVHLSQSTVERAHPWICLNKSQAWPHYHALTCYFFSVNAWL